MDSQTLSKIKLFAEAQYSLSQDPLHDITHIERVVKNATQIASALQLQKEVDFNLLVACCYLHDIVMIQQDNSNLFQRAKNHVMEPYLNRTYLPAILDEFGLSKEERSIIFRAIINHPHSIPYRRLNKKGDWYTKILQDADTLDYVSKERERSAVQNGKKIWTNLIKAYLWLIRRGIKYFLNTPVLCSKTPT